MAAEMPLSFPPDIPSSTPRPTTGTAKDANTTSIAAAETSGNTTSCLSCRRMPALAFNRFQLRDRRSNIGPPVGVVKGGSIEPSPADCARRRLALWPKALYDANHMKRVAGRSKEASHERIVE